jgi:uncharacterized protein
MAKSPGMQALSEAELDTLAEFLASLNNPDALTLEELDGFFCALIASPETVPPQVYLPVIWGGALPDEDAFSSLEEANARMSLIMRHWNSIIADFETEGIHLPPIVEPGIDGIPGRAWARGFMLGTRLAPKGWGGLWQEDNEGQVITIPLVAGEVDPGWPAEPLSQEKKDELLHWMIAGAGRAYRYFAGARAKRAEEMYEEPFDGGFDDTDERFPETSVRAEPKVGRNEACPCGSGKKYKKCCGDR